MAQRDKKEARLRSIPADFTWDDLVSVLKANGFVRADSSGGSHRVYHNEEFDLTLDLVKPHPGNEVKRYLLRNIVVVLDDLKDLKELADND